LICPIKKGYPSYLADLEKGGGLNEPLPQRLHGMKRARILLPRPNLRNGSSLPTISGILQPPSTLEGPLTLFQCVRPLMDGAYTRTLLPKSFLVQFEKFGILPEGQSVWVLCRVLQDRDTMLMHLFIEATEDLLQMKMTTKRAKKMRMKTKIYLTIAMIIQNHCIAQGPTLRLCLLKPNIIRKN
jgi:hypothetical protein